jgi:hypothetical protein
MDVRLDRGQQLGLEEHLPQAEPLERVALQYLYDGGREELAHVAQPARDARR